MATQNISLLDQFPQWRTSLVTLTQIYIAILSRNLDQHFLNLMYIISQYEITSQISKKLDIHDQDNILYLYSTDHQNKKLFSHQMDIIDRDRYSTANYD